MEEEKHGIEYLWRSRCRLCGCVHHTHVCKDYEEWQGHPCDRTLMRGRQRIKDILTTCEDEGYECE